ncbi:hypothetical protein HanRHA438_Chr02g0095911 [Helianthus annuus]|nr:hypothetical protein HanRHA438_Chr02g0095911 [Helianthus annuus]
MVTFGFWFLRFLVLVSPQVEEIQLGLLGFGIGFDLGFWVSGFWFLTPSLDMVPWLWFGATVGTAFIFPICLFFCFYTCSMTPFKSLSPPKRDSLFSFRQNNT